MHFWHPEIKQRENSAGIHLGNICDDAEGGFCAVIKEETFWKILPALRNLLMNIIEEFSIELEFLWSAFCTGWVSVLCA